MAEQLSKIKSGEIQIEILNKKHDLTKFKSYEQELVDFLNEDALDNQTIDLSTTFLWFYKQKLIAYVTLLTDKINLEGSLKTSFKEKGVYYKSLPAIKIGRLCVHDDYLRRGLGKLMVEFTIKIAKEINSKKAGCRFITLDAKRNSNKKLDSIHFYKHLGFGILKERIKGTTPMYFDLRID